MESRNKVHEINQNENQSNEAVGMVQGILELVETRQQELNVLKQQLEENKIVFEEKQTRNHAMKIYVKEKLAKEELLKNMTTTSKSLNTKILCKARDVYTDTVKYSNLLVIDEKNLKKLKQDFNNKAGLIEIRQNNHDKKYNELKKELEDLTRNNSEAATENESMAQEKNSIYEAIADIDQKLSIRERNVVFEEEHKTNMELNCQLKKEIDTIGNDYEEAAKKLVILKEDNDKNQQKHLYELEEYDKKINEVNATLNDLTTQYQTNQKINEEETCKLDCQIKELENRIEIQLNRAKELTRKDEEIDLIVKFNQNSLKYQEYLLTQTKEYEKEINEIERVKDELKTLESNAELCDKILQATSDDEASLNCMEERWREINLKKELLTEDYQKALIKKQEQINEESKLMERECNDISSDITLSDLENNGIKRKIDELEKEKNKLKDVLETLEKQLKLKEEMEKKNSHWESDSTACDEIDTGFYARVQKKLKTNHWYK
ncbi:unnamed protein product [Phyllotreta striolata]|uniref:Uncharacterized protein n=1 Tax=Phyllotreta striolata TaxID=444603 RepID=A0A9N9XST6_PHYSR|nr:unnamed protein product [Phyllotreta striolata]